MTQVDPAAPAPPSTKLSRELRPPKELRDRFLLLSGSAERDRAELDDVERRVKDLDEVLARAKPVKAELERLSANLFADVLTTVQEKLTQALREVFVEDLALKAERRYDGRSGETIRFSIVRQGKEEDILEGQGGSVINVLSVGLRMFALATQDPAVHRPFLVLDEQDCWLRPDLVPRLVNIVASAAKALNLQVLMISHHDPQLFAGLVGAIYELVPAGDHVTVKPRPVGRPAEEAAAAGALADPTPADVGHGLAPSAPLRERVASGRPRFVELTELTDFGLRVARLEGQPSALLVFADEPLAVDGADGADGLAVAVLDDGAVAVDQALLRRAVQVRAPALGVTVELRGGPDGALTYEVRADRPSTEALERLVGAGLSRRLSAAADVDVPAVTAGAVGALEAAAVAAARSLERELLELVSYPHPADPGWAAWRERVAVTRDELECAAVALAEATPPLRLRRVLERLDAQAARLPVPSSGSRPERLARVAATQPGAWWLA